MATTWTDPTLTPLITIPKAAHVKELRTAINTERTRRALAAQSFNQTITVDSSHPQKEHIEELRTGLNFAPLSLTDTTLTTNSTTMKTSHIEELRIKFNALESHAMVGGSTDCNSSCTGLCVGCSGTCTGSCVVVCNSNCINTCTSCHGTCSDGCNTCSLGCNDNCSGTCNTGCSGCRDTCEGCSGCGNICGYSYNINTVHPPAPQSVNGYSGFGPGSPWYDMENWWIRPMYGDAVWDGGVNVRMQLRPSLPGSYIFRTAPFNDTSVYPDGAWDPKYVTEAQYAYCTPRSGAYVQYSYGGGSDGVVNAGGSKTGKFLKSCTFTYNNSTDLSRLPGDITYGISWTNYVYR